jgi:hypothetical protein
MQLKLKLGGENDIPMDEVMIYIQNIPLDRSNQIMAELVVMEAIKDEAHRFRDMRIGMSVKEIMDSADLVVGRIIAHEVAKRGVPQIASWEGFRRASFELLREVESVKLRIYGEGESTVVMLIYLSVVLEQGEAVGWVARLLEDDELHGMYAVEQRAVENLVLYMYKWAFSRDSRYVANEAFLVRLLELLPEDSDCRVFM